MWIRYLAVVFIILSLAFAVQAASQNIIALQGRAVNSTTGQLLSSGSVTLRIYSAPTGGTLAYEENFTSAIFNGTFNVVAGNSSSLSLLYNTRYWLELRIGSIEVIGSSTGAGRQPFYPTSGPADATEINISSGGTIEARLNVLSSNLTSVNTSLAVLNTRQSADNATLSNRIDTVSTDSGVLSSNLTAVNTSLALVNARQSADNTTLTNLIGTKLNLGGGTMTGNLNVSGYFGDFLTLTVGRRHTYKRLAFHDRKHNGAGHHQHQHHRRALPEHRRQLRHRAQQAEMECAVRDRSEHHFRELQCVRVCGCQQPEREGADNDAGSQLLKLWRFLGD
ncbi:MAG: hypothetical protein HYT73_05150 [Candidatus Aenigmarchaeota archaeon]|nr:hypothetical protein [Candidatus Aenigmarchaeota archaeon]